MVAAAPRPISFDGLLGRQIIDLHVWAVRQGLLGAAGEELFGGFCQRLIDAGVPLWRGYAAMRTLHPQWGGYGYDWRRELNAIEPQQFGRRVGPNWLKSPFAYLLEQATTMAGDGHPWLDLRRHLTGPEAQLDFPVLEELAAAGGSDYFAEIVRFGSEGDPSHGTGIAYSFATDRATGFSDDDLTLLKAV
jgi:adenylate cyclase